MGDVFKPINAVIKGVGDVIEGSVKASVAPFKAMFGTPEMPSVQMPGAPTALAGDKTDIEGAETAAAEAARKRAEEEKRRRALFGRESTFAGKQAGLVGTAPTGKKTLLGR